MFSRFVATLGNAKASAISEMGILACCRIKLTASATSVSSIDKVSVDPQRSENRDRCGENAGRGGSRKPQTAELEHALHHVSGLNRQGCCNDPNHSGEMNLL